jgi:hypothetical protein
VAEWTRSALELLRHDRLARWSALGAVPIAWFTIALASPLVLLLLPLLVLGLWLCFRYGPLERSPETDWSDVA